MTTSPRDLLPISFMPQRLAVLDLGSTSFSLTAIEVARDGHFDRILRKRATLRLGAHTNEAGAIPENDCAGAVEAVRRLRAKAKSVGCEVLLPVGTAILRDAANAPELTTRIEEVLEQPVRILSGEEEARLSYAALRHRLELGRKRVFAMDLGGGSLELAVGTASLPDWTTSLQIGVTRLHAECVHSDPLSEQDAQSIRDRVREQLTKGIAELDAPSPARLVAAGGTIRALARLALAWRSRSERSELNGMVLTQTELESVLAQLMRVTHQVRLAMPTVQPRRADLLPVGGLILDTLLDVFDLDELVISDWGLREGILLEALAPAVDSKKSAERRS